jgi:hypothetical protein
MFILGMVFSSIDAEVFDPLLLVNSSAANLWFSMSYSSGSEQLPGVK